MLTKNQIMEKVALAAGVTPITKSNYTEIAKMVHEHTMYPRYLCVNLTESQIRLIASLPESAVKSEAEKMSTDDWTDLAVSAVAIWQYNAAVTRTLSS